jgi:hypothetical protein
MEKKKSVKFSRSKMYWLKRKQFLFCPDTAEAFEKEIQAITYLCLLLECLQSMLSLECQVLQMMYHCKTTQQFMMLSWDFVPECGH